MNNYGGYKQLPKPLKIEDAAAEANKQDTQPAKTIKDDSALKSEYNEYITTEITNRLQDMKPTEIIALQNQLVDSMLVSTASVLNHIEEILLNEKYVGKNDILINFRNLNPKHETLLFIFIKLYTVHFNLPSFFDWNCKKAG